MESSVLGLSPAINSHLSSTSNRPRRLDGFPGSPYGIHCRVHGGRWITRGDSRSSLVNIDGEGAGD